MSWNALQENAINIKSFIIVLHNEMTIWDKNK